MAKPVPFRPLSDRILVRRTAAEERTPGGLIIPGAAAETQMQGVCLAVGPGRVQEDGSLAPMSVKPGDTVVFTRYAGTEVDVEEEPLLVLSEQDVLGVLEA